MNCNATSSWKFLLIFSFITIFNKMEFAKFMDFIFFNSFTLLVNFPDQLITDMSEPVLKS